MAKARTTAFFCKECGYESSKWMGQCPACKEWNSLVEEPVSKTPAGSLGRMGGGSSKPAALTARPSLLSEIDLDEQDRIPTGFRELDRVLDQAGRVVSQLTNYPSFALSSGLSRMTIRRFDLLMVERNAFIIVVMTDTDIVRNRLIRLPSDLTEAQLQMLNTLLNTTFTGLTLEEITPELMRVAQHAAGEAYGLISLVVSFAMEVLESLEQRTVHTSGLAHLLELPEYRSLERAQPLMSYLSEEADPARFPVPKDDPMKILIGPENVADALKDTSVVVASYDIGDGMQGVIGVVGPTRMDYAKITARLSYLAEGLSRLFGQGELPQGRDDEK